MIKSIKALFKGFWVVFKHLFKKPVTLEYPEKKRELSDAFRGKLKVEGCIGFPLPDTYFKKVERPKGEV